MNEETKTTIPSWFWIVGGVCLAWNLLGVMAFFMNITMGPEAVAALPEAERQLYETTPMWATVAFGVAVIGAALGCIMLLLKKGLALPLFIVSFLAILAQMYHSFFMSNSFEVFGPGGLIMPVMVVAIAVFLIWFARMSKDKLWII